MLTAAGIQFLSRKDICDYVNQYNQACMNSSLLCVWSGAMYSQAKTYYDYLDTHCPHQKRICAQALEPYSYTDNVHYNFNKFFVHKKVLIITSHKETTQKQLSIHHELFINIKHYNVLYL